MSARLSPVRPANGSFTTLVYRRRRPERTALYRLVQHGLRPLTAACVWTSYPSLARVLYRIRRGEIPRVRTFVAPRRVEHPQARPDPQGVGAVEIELPADRS